MDICPRTGHPCSIPKQFAVTEVTPEGLKTFNCCQKCIMNQPGISPLQGGILPTLPNPLSDIQQLLQKIGQVKGPQQTQKTLLPTCPTCGSNPIDIEQAGRFGCPTCYKSFKQDIESMLMRHHGSIQHVGKVPKAWKARQEAGANESKETTVDRAIATIKRHVAVPMDARIKILEEKMAICVKAEDYERAAVIRDVIKEIKAFVASQTPSETPSIS